MNFCSKCGSDDIHLKMEQERFVRYVCKACGTIHYKNPLMVVGCLPIYEQKILLCQRGIQPCKGYWNLPAGFMEMNETVTQGALREAKEETGLDMELIRLHSIYTSRKKNQVMLHFLAKVKDLDYELNEETVAIELFDFNAIPWDQLAFQSNIFAIQNYLDSLSKNTQSLFIGDSLKEN
ncbi:MAG TPA: ADP-ribose pyrophosphatase [Microscillaceae bacterium]|nr:ADP-ribose pyrophosphatase [Microscillaceae bacterium]